ncbi:MBL fold metallo-hydrolase [Bradyrhizobium sp. BR 10289]|uniref:MBL fold metallo-hydrolase n=1 Tax=Bradyrhizobium sp. BR 10289 TaxID=2749993 RepID=UPI001C652D6F|nr:MBL fold metallo-hydrolase [Bradyrhizobium sp. BR 10289]MBW7970196.1 MBL fold metallo-hydrolase [Bradyrhizobium sp. BR 10289]
MNEHSGRTIDDFRVMKLTEKTIAFPTTKLLPGAKATEAGADELVVSVHSWLIESKGKKIIVDTGIGNHKQRAQAVFNDQNSDFLERLESAGFGRNQVTHVLLTHLHGDHVGWNTLLERGRWVPTFPKATYVMPRASIDHLRGNSDDPLMPLYLDSIEPVISSGQAVLIQPGEEPLEGFQYVSTPGHSRDHCSIILRTPDRTCLFAGDIMHHPVQVQHPELNSVFCASPEMAQLSRHKMLAFAADTRSLYFSSHFAETSVGEVTRSNENFRWTFV